MSSLPLLLAGLRVLVNTDFDKLSRDCVALFVRHSVFANANPADLETAFYSAARALGSAHANTKDGTESLRAARQILAAIDPSDKVVEDGGARLLLSRSHAQYVLAQIANSKQSKTEEVAVDDANLEHIYP